MSATMEREQTPDTTGEGTRSPWSWVPTLYFAEGLPYVLVNVVSVVMFAKMGVADTEIAFWTSLLAFPWVVKPLWGPLVDLYWTKRKWVLLMQVLLAGSMAGVAMALQGPGNMWWWGSLAALGVAALLSATHDIAADGFYMVGLSERKQSVFVGIRSSFYRIAMISGQGLLVILAGQILRTTGPTPVELPVAAGPAGASAIVPPASPPADAFLKFDPPVVALEAGTTAPVSVVLAQPPKDVVPVSIDRKQSVLSAMFPIGPEQLIKVTNTEGKKLERLAFTPENWNQPQQIVLEADSKLKEPVQATVMGSSGDVALTWTYCFGGVAGMFLLLGMFHAFAMPRPAGDGNIQLVSRPPFLRAFSVIFWIIAIPLAAYMATFYGVKWALMEGGRLGGITWSAEVFSFITTIVVVFALWALFRAAPVRRGAMAAFQGASRASGIPFAEVFISFFSKPGIARMIAFLILYRFGEGLLVKISTPFLLKPRSAGGLGLSQAEYGMAYGTIGVLTMVAGGILGGLLVARGGLRKWFLISCMAINVPDLLYVYLAWAQPESYSVVVACIATETFGYGFGFAAYMLYMLYVAGEGQYKTSHFALTTAFMALSMILPGMISGAIRDALDSYFYFFIIVCIATLPGFIMLKFIPLDPDFGKRTTQA